MRSANCVTGITALQIDVWFSGQIRGKELFGDREKFKILDHDPTLTNLATICSYIQTICKLAEISETEIKEKSPKAAQVEEQTAFLKSTRSTQIYQILTYNWYKKHSSLWCWKVFDSLIESFDTKCAFKKGFVRSSRPYPFNTNWTFGRRLSLFFFWFNFLIYKWSFKCNH